MESQRHEEKGYLYEDFRIFYLEELAAREIEYHYHNFDKLLVFFKGNIEYAVEGKSYTLLPDDIVLVPRGDSHRVKLSGSGREDIGYTRLVIYLSPQYTAKIGRDGRSLRDCFLRTEERHSHVLRLKDRSGSQLLQLAAGLRDSVREGSPDEFSELYQQTLLLQFLIGLNRKMSDESVHYVDTSHCNPKVVEIIGHINSHLTEDIDIDTLSERFYISKYHMMRQFKAETGYTIGSYINQKRLLCARELLKQGRPVTQALLDAGFHDCSTFTRAYKQMFGELPSKTRKL